MDRGNVMRDIIEGIQCVKEALECAERKQQNELEQAVIFGTRMWLDKKALTEQNKRLIERVRELENKYEPENIPYRGPTPRTQKDYPVRERLQAV
jgi:hypothetical protein